MVQNKEGKQWILIEDFLGYNAEREDVVTNMMLND